MVIKSYDQGAVLKAIRNPYSIKLIVYIDGKIKEHLGTVDARGIRNSLHINLKRLRFWSLHGIKIDKTVPLLLDWVLERHYFLTGNGKPKK